MASPTVLIKKVWDIKSFLRDQEMPGRPSVRSRTANSWIDDLMELKKMVTLCSFCEHSFTAGLKQCDYRKEIELGPVVSDCVGCSGRMMKCAMYIHESIYKVVRSTEADRHALGLSRQKRIRQGYL